MNTSGQRGNYLFTVFCCCLLSDTVFLLNQSSRTIYLSRLMGKPTICIGENKDADQLRGNREADQRLCFRYFLFFLNPKFQASSSFLCCYRSVCVGPGRKPLVFPRDGSFNITCMLKFKTLMNTCMLAISLKQYFM